MIIQNSISQVLATNLWEISIKSQGVGIPPTSSVEGGRGGRGGHKIGVSAHILIFCRAAIFCRITAVHRLDGPFIHMMIIKSSRL